MKKKTDKENEEVPLAEEANIVKEEADKLDVVEGIDVDSNEYTELQDELKAATLQAEENLDGWQRAQADFANFRKRMERDRDHLKEDQTAKIIIKYLDVVDDLDLALKNRPDKGEGADWSEGVELIYRKMMTILENEDVTPMLAKGQIFDPNLHEAISQEESTDYESGHIIEVLKEGYMIGERVLRPSLVRIAS